MLHPGQGGQVLLHVDHLQLLLLPRGDGRGAKVLHLLCRAERQAQVVPAGQPEGPGRGVEGLPLPLPPARLLQQERSARQVQIQHPQRQEGGDQGYGEPTSIQVTTSTKTVVIVFSTFAFQICPGKGLGLQKIYPKRLPA